MKTNNGWLYGLIGLLLVIGTTCLLFLHFTPVPKPVKSTPTSAAVHPPKKTAHPPKKPESPATSKNIKLIFGIDTANAYTPQVSQCVAKKYDNPKQIGRYLQTKKGYFSGLTKTEVQYVHKKGAKILPIYNHYTKYVGTSQGQRSATEAINRAKQLGIPKSKAIFIDIEPKMNYNADFFVSWSYTLQKAGYKPGIYGDFGDSKLRSIYLEARHKSASMKSTLLWTNSPNEGTLHKPTTFKGKSPDQANTLVWQYGVDQPCKIDSDLVKSNLLKDLW